MPRPDSRQSAVGLSAITPTSNAGTVTRLLGDQDPVDRDELTELLVDALSGLSEMDPNASLTGDDRLLMSKWLDGEPVAAMADIVPGDPQEVTRYIEEVFSYLLPWGISALSAHCRPRG